MEAYLELLDLNNYDQKKFYKLSVICALQQIFVIMLVYLLVMLGQPLIGFFMAIYSQAFINLYMIHHLHEHWVKKEIES